MEGVGGELNPLLNFQSPVRFTSSAPRGSIKPPSQSQSQFLDMSSLFCNKNVASNPAFLLEN